MRIGLLNNLRAGRSDKQVWRLLQLIRNYPEVVHVETDHASAVPEALSDLSRQEVDLLVVNGGDGTLAHALTEILEHGVFDGRVPMIAVLRGGRTNTTALDIGAHRDPVRSLETVIQAARQGRLEERIRRRDVLRVESDGEVRCGMFFGGGVIYRGIELVHSSFPQGRARGVFGSTTVIGALVGKLLLGGTDGMVAPDKAQVHLDGELIAPGEFTLFMASTLPQLFARLRPFWGEGPGGVRFTGLASDARHRARTVPGLLFGHPNVHATEDNGYLSRNCKRAELRFDCGFTIDGEQCAPRVGRTLSITAENNVRFVRA
ncbi:MAG: diacylglycerol kinase family protein [Myxococcota bacterium]|nr:hypothetical protein [Myxococcales bacterium]